MFSKNNHSPFSKNIRPFIIGIIFAAAVMIIFMLLFAFVMSCFDLAEGIESAFSSFTLGAGCFVNGYISCKIFRHNGLFKGLQCGLIVFGLCFIFALITGALSGALFISKLLICTITGAAGGVFGVNSKLKI